MQEGEDLPLAPNQGLKNGLKTYLDNYNPITDDLRIMDGKLKSIDIDATVVINRNSDPSFLKEKILLEIKKFFDIRNRNMGDGFSVSNLVSVIQNISGIKSVTLFKPFDDLPSIKKLSDGVTYGVGLDELVVLGNQNIRIYFESGNTNL